jgi:hypothetical protein
MLRLESGKFSSLCCSPYSFIVKDVPGFYYDSVMLSGFLHHNRHAYGWVSGMTTLLTEYPTHLSYCLTKCWDVFLLVMGPTIGLIVAQVWVELSHENGVVIMVAKLNSEWSHDWCRFCIHLRSLKHLPFWNGWSYGIKKLWHPGHHRWHDLPTEFHEILLIGSEVISGWHIDRWTERQHGDLISFTCFFKGSRLKQGFIYCYRWLTMTIDGLYFVLLLAQPPTGRLATAYRLAAIWNLHIHWSVGASWYHPIIFII